MIKWSENQDANYKLVKKGIIIDDGEPDFFKFIMCKMIIQELSKFSNQSKMIFWYT